MGKGTDKENSNQTSAIVEGEGIQKIHTPAAEVSDKLQFSNAETARNFESLVTTDRTVHKAGVYSGPFKNITPAMAAAMVQQGSNMIKEKS